MRRLLRPCCGILAALCLLPCLSYGQEDVKASPASLSFGPVLVGQTSLPKVVSLINSGTSEITVSAVSISGDFAIPFNGCAHGVKPFTHCSVKVTFTPSQLGTSTGTLTFVDSASNSPQTVSLTGGAATAVPTQTKVTSSVDFTMAGEPVTLTATVKSLGGGTIPDGDQFYFYGSYGALGYARLQNGIATLTTTNIQGYAGKTTNTTVAAEFLGDSSFLTSVG